MVIERIDSSPLPLQNDILLLLLDSGIKLTLSVQEGGSDACAQSLLLD